jgi:hypothetical protein
MPQRVAVVRGHAGIVDSPPKKSCELDLLARRQREKPNENNPKGVFLGIFDAPHLIF